jgi:type II secretory pathway component PulM
MDINSFFESIKNLSSQLSERIQRLLASERDRKAVLLGAGVLFILIVYIIFQSFSSGKARLEKKAIALESDLKRIQTLRQEYIESKRRLEEVTSRIKTEDVALISVVEKVLVDAQVDRSSFSISSRTDTSGDLYDEKSVDVDIKKLPLNKAVDLLYKIQTNPNFLKVSKFRIRTRFDNPNLLDASFRVSTFKFKQVS